MSWNPARFRLSSTLGYCISCEDILRLATVRTNVGTVAGALEGDFYRELPASDVGALLRMPGWHDIARTQGQTHRLGPASLAQLVTTPEKILCLGLNYESHIRELGRELPVFPTLFSKYSDALVGPSDPIVLPGVSNEADWEAELALVIGETIRGGGEDAARSAIAGFTIMNDITMRDWQYRTSQWLQGKSFESSTPIGPSLVTPDQVDWAADLAISCHVDGQLMQDSRTSDLLFSPIQIVSYISQFTTLRPGDVIATGTPGGVGAARDPKVFLKAGQVVRTEIEGIGVMANRCVAQADYDETASFASLR